MAKGVKFELSGNDEGNDQLTKRQFVYANKTTTTVTTTTTTITASTATTITASETTTAKAEDIEAKNSGKIAGKVELDKNVLCAYRL